MNEPKSRHDRIGFRIARRLADWVDGPGSGEAAVHRAWTSAGDNYFVPDAWWVRDDHVQADDVSLAPRYPDLVVEVRSPSTWRYDLGPKRHAYEVGGVSELWLVDTASDTVIVNRRSSPGAPTFDVVEELGSGEVLGSPLLPGFSLPVDELFGR